MNNTYLNKKSFEDLILEYLVEEIKKENNEERFKNKLQIYNKDANIEVS